jgi:sporulation protein YlmC with PRC-barrel domain
MTPASQRIRAPHASRIMSQAVFRLLLVVSVGGAGALACADSAQAQVAGSTTVGLSVTEVAEVATGWSAKNNLLGKPVFNEKGDKVGLVEDLIVAPNKTLSYLIIGTGGFLGIARHDVAIPVAQVVQKEGRFVMAGATKESLKRMAAFEYVRDTSERDQFVAKADRDVALAKAKLAELEADSAKVGAEARGELDVQISGIKRDLKVAELKLGELNRAGIERWKRFEREVGAATARLRKWVAGSPS